MTAALCQDQNERNEGGKGRKTRKDHWSVGTVLVLQYNFPAFGSMEKERGKKGDERDWPA